MLSLQHSKLYKVTAMVIFVAVILLSDWGRVQPAAANYPSSDCIGDLNQDYQKNLQDYASFVVAYGQQATTSGADLNQDNKISLTDYAIFRQEFTQPCLVSKKIMTIGFNPTENGQSYADHYFLPLMGQPATDMQQRQFKAMRDTMASLSENRVQIELVKHLEISEPPNMPEGLGFTLENYSQCVWGSDDFEAEACDQKKQQFPYQTWFAQHQICEQAAAVGADEIWMFSLPYVMGYEAFMVGPSPGFFTNGPAMIMPNCDQHYIVINGTYDRPETLLHSMSHRFEGTMLFLVSSWNDDERWQHWDRFWDVKVHKADEVRCGNNHFPPNARFEYDYSNPAAVVQNCEDWKNFPHYQGTSSSLACQSWGCDDWGWQAYWLGQLPAAKGSTELTMKTGKEVAFPRNWWTFLFSPSRVLELKANMQ